MLCSGLWLHLPSQGAQRQRRAEGLSWGSMGNLLLLCDSQTSPSDISILIPHRSRQGADAKGTFLGEQNLGEFLSGPSNH